MNYLKFTLMLMLMPFVAMADNPVIPIDKDSDTAPMQDSAQVESRSESVEIYETSSSYSDSQGIEDVIVTATRRETSLMELRLLFLQLLKKSSRNMAFLISKI